MKENQITKTLLYIGDEGEVSIDVIIDSERETRWATQKTMAELFNVKENTITYHLKNIFKDEELNENSVTRKIRVTASDGKIQLSDTKVAKNYLSESELSELNKLVELYLNFAELQATREIPMSMKDWAEQLDKFLDFVGYQILKGKGKVSRSEINEFVKLEFDKFRPIQDELYKSDYNEFEERTRKLLNN